MGHSVSGGSIVKNPTVASSERIPLGVKIAYGGAEGSVTTVWTAFAVYFLFFLTEVVGISASVGGMVLGVAVLWDAVTDPAMGIISDRTHSRYGRRRPYIIASAVPFCVTFWLLFSTPPLHGFLRVAYFVLMAVLMHTAMTVLSVPHAALVPEMTTDYDERTSLASYRFAWSVIGSLFSAVLLLLIANRFEDRTVGWSVAAAVVGFLCLFPILLTWRYTRGWERYSESSEIMNIRDMRDAIFGNRSLRYALCIFIFGITANYAGGSIAVYFLEYWMGFSKEQISLYWLIFFVSNLLWVPVILYLSYRMGKRGAYIICIGIGAITYGVGNIMVQPGQVLVMYVLSVIGALAAAATYQLLWAMIPDVVEVDEFKTGKRREGLYYGVYLLTTKLASALALFIVGQVLEFIGYIPNIEQPHSVLLGIRLLFGPGVGGLLLISAVITIFFPMTRKRHKALLKAIEAKRTGVPWNEGEFKELL